MKRVRGPRATEYERKAESEGQKTREGEEESERGSLGGKRHCILPVGDAHTGIKADTRVLKRKGVVVRLAGRLVPLSMHADGLALY